MDFSYQAWCRHHYLVGHVAVRGSGLIARRLMRVNSRSGQGPLRTPAIRRLLCWQFATLACSVRGRVAQPDVNRRRSMTPSNVMRIKDLRADRRRDPTPINMLDQNGQYEMQREHPASLRDFI